MGCTDENASNFNPDATLDNGQCTYDVFGCTLLIACNYDPSATVNDGQDFTGCFGCDAYCVTTTTKRCTLMGLARSRHKARTAAAIASAMLMGLDL